MYAHITLFCLILERMGVKKTGYAEHALYTGHTYGAYNIKYFNYTGYQYLYSKQSIQQIRRKVGEKHSTHTNRDTLDESSLVM